MSVLQQMEKKDESKPWKGICNKRCWYAKHDRCKCKCHKENHGKGVIKKLMNMEGKSDETDKSRNIRGTP